MPRENKPTHNDANKVLPREEHEERIPGEKLRRRKQQAEQNR